MEAGKFSFKFSRQTQKNLVGSSKYAYFSHCVNNIVEVEMFQLAAKFLNERIR
jgi:hypothetical protein